MFVMYVNNFFLSYSFAKKAIRFCFQNLTAFLSCCIQFQNKADCAWLSCYRLTKIHSYHQRSDGTSYSHQASSLANVFRRDKTWLFFYINCIPFCNYFNKLKFLVKNTKISIIAFFNLTFSFKMKNICWI